LTGVLKITNFVKAHRTKWFGHVMKRSDSKYLKSAVEWKLIGMRPRGRPKKRWRVGINQDLLKEIRDTKLRIKSTKSRRVESGVSGDKTLEEL